MQQIWTGLLVLALMAAGEAAKAQPGDTLEWLPVGTEWVYFGYHSSEESAYPLPPRVQLRVIKDTILHGLPAKAIFSTRLNKTVLYLALSKDTIYYAGPSRSKGILEWKPYFSMQAKNGSFIEGYGARLGNHEYPNVPRNQLYRVEVVSSGDTLLNNYRLPYVEVRMQEDGQTPKHYVFLCSWMNKREGYYYYRLYKDLISTDALFSDLGGLYDNYWVFGCGLRCFTHPQLGTIRFDSPARQAQFPDCHYGDLVSRPGRAAATLDLRLHPNPATDRVAVQFAGWGRLEAYDAQGRQVLRREGSGPLDVDVSGWAAGLYAVRVSGPQGVSVGRLVVGR